MKVSRFKMNKEENFIKAYEIVFVDAVKNYIEEYNYNSDDKIELSEKEIKKIADKLIYDNEYIWEIINETIGMYIRNILNKKEGKENE